MSFIAGHDLADHRIVVCDICAALAIESIAFGYNGSWRRIWQHERRQPDGSEVCQEVDQCRYCATLDHGYFPRGVIMRSSAFKDGCAACAEGKKRLGVK